LYLSRLRMMSLPRACALAALLARRQDKETPSPRGRHRRRRRRRRPIHLAEGGRSKTDSRAERERRVHVMTGTTKTDKGARRSPTRRSPVRAQAVKLLSPSASLASAPSCRGCLERRTTLCLCLSASVSLLTQLRSHAGAGGCGHSAGGAVSQGAAQARQGG
jgi:hypothetical protein